MKETGAVALVGSGEYLPVMQDLESALLNSGIANGKPNRFLQIPTAAGEESHERLEFWEMRAMAMSSDVPNFFRMKSEGIPGFNVIPHIRPIPHYNKFFGWIPDSAAKIVMKAPEGTLIIGIDEDTALVTGLDPRTSLTENTWQVYGEASVHILSGAPSARFESGELVKLQVS